MNLVVVSGIAGLLSLGVGGLTVVSAVLVLRKGSAGFAAGAVMLLVALTVACGIGGAVVSRRHVQDLPRNGSVTADLARWNQEQVGFAALEVGLWAAVPGALLGTLAVVLALARKDNGRVALLAMLAASVTACGAWALKQRPHVAPTPNEVELKVLTVDGAAPDCGTTLSGLAFAFWSVRERPEFLARLRTCVATLEPRIAPNGEDAQANALLSAGLLDEALAARLKPPTLKHEPGEHPGHDSVVK